jgi:hypothetical protein
VIGKHFCLTEIYEIKAKHINNGKYVTWYIHYVHSIRNQLSYCCGYDIHISLAFYLKYFNRWTVLICSQDKMNCSKQF